MAIGIKELKGAAHRAYNSPLTRLNIYDGAVRSGKTVTAMLRWAKWIATDAPPGPLMISGKTERTVRQNLIDPMLEIFGPKYTSYSQGNHEFSLFGRKHIIVGANDERAEAKIRGITLAGVLGDEITLWAESFFKMALSRLSVPGAAFLGTTNPDSPMHWLNQEYLQRAHEINLSRHVFRLTLEDNPYLDPDFVSSLHSEYVGLWKKRFIDGLWVVAEGAIYDMFDPDRHTWKDAQGDKTAPPPPGRWRAVGIDYGTTNPSVYIALTQLNDGRLLAHDEWRWDSKKQGRQLTAKEHSDAYFKWKRELGAARDITGQKIDRVSCDPSANGFILQLWRDGERVVKPGDNDVNRGIMDIGSLLQREKLVFHAPTTRVAMEEMASYAWDPDATEKGEDKPLKVADHAPDALRYIVRGTRLRWKPMLDGLAD